MSQAIVKTLKRRKEANRQDLGFQRILRSGSWLLILLLFAILAMLIQLSWPVWKGLGFGFLLSSDWNPGEDRFGILPFVYGTLVSSFLALLVAVPISVAVALFLTELAPPRIARVLGFLVEMLAAIPSVIYGLWGIFVLAPWMQNVFQPFVESNLGPESSFGQIVGARISGVFAGPGYGVGMLTAGFVLAIMIVPTITSICREIFLTVSKPIREAAIGLGATKWEMILVSVLKTTKSGIFGAIILGLGRALGETMAVTMVIGNRNEISERIMAPGQTMASLIANEYPEASGLHLSSLASVGVVLFVISLLVNGLARWIIWRSDRNKGSAV